MKVPMTLVICHHGGGRSFGLRFGKLIRRKASLSHRSARFSSDFIDQKKRAESLEDVGNLIAQVSLGNWATHIRRNPPL